MYRLVTLAVAAAVCAMPAPAQDRKDALALLKDAKGRDILNELRLREAAAVKLVKDQKAWAKDIKPESIAKNPYIAKTPDALAADMAASKFKSFPSDRLFTELNRRAEQKGIFGSDDRVDVYTLEARRAEIAAAMGDTTFLDGVLKNAPAMCCLVNASRLTPFGADLRMTTVPFKDSRHATLKLCPLERFREQPTGAFCSGFLVAPDLVVTAGHCISAADMGNARFVFGYRMNDATTAVTTFPTANVYKAAALVGRVLDNGTGEDWALVRLDRAVVGVTPVKFRTAGKIANDAQLYVIGFPVGLPCKVSDNARVNLNGDPFAFHTNLDTYGGNSGSAVFNRLTHEVEGILVRGGQDFEFVADGVSGCIRSVVLADSVGTEACTRATFFAGKLPKP